jgi:hypothetical protein
VNRSDSRSRICSGDIARIRAAASSIANGKPSSREQIWAMVAVFSMVSSKPGTAAAARSANSATASSPDPKGVGSE